MVKKPSLLYVCSRCGGEHVRWAGKCDFCGEWNTLRELKVEVSQKKSEVVQAEVKKLSSVSRRETDRMSSGIDIVDLVFGGGIVRGSVLLLGGQPGVGKSTLVWQIASGIKRKVLYIAGEESPEQIKIRSDRIGIDYSEISIIDNQDINSWLDNLERGQFDLLIIDSIQTVYDSTLSSSAGSILQLKQCALLIIEKVKSISLATIVIGHVTKEGEVAGPKTLEHLVDGVFYLEGDRYSSERFLRSQKNRFGSTDELGVFDINEKGLVAKKDFGSVSADDEIPPGVVRTAVSEGSRVYMLEVQSLVHKTGYGIAQRNTVGYDRNRLQMILAVLAKHSQIDLSDYDVYLNISDGYRLKDPMTDVAVAVSLAGSLLNKKVDAKNIFLGEIDLSGRVRLKSDLKRIIKSIKAAGLVAKSPKESDLGKFIKNSLKES
jgi:DNA repair protein RadA/Sms